MLVDGILIMFLPHAVVRMYVLNDSDMVSPSLDLHTLTSSVCIAPLLCQNVDAKGSRDLSLDVPRRGTEVKDDDPIIPFGPQPTVSRFGAISRTSKTGYQTNFPVQTMPSAPQNPSSKHMAMSGKTL